MTYDQNNDKRQKRNFMCTINFKEHQDEDPLKFLPDFTKLNWLERVCFQLERGDESNLLHWQVFVENNCPVAICRMSKDIISQNKFMYIKDPEKEYHKMAGRNYVRKGKEIDGHRYTWCRSTGWENKHFPTIPVSIPDKGFAMDTRAKVLECLRNNIKECKNYILNENKKCSTMKIV